MFPQCRLIFTPGSRFRFGVIQTLFAITLLWPIVGPGAITQDYHSNAWLRLYQFEKTAFGDYLSPVTSKEFFFSKNGQRDPRAEFENAIEAFRDPSLTFGIQRLPAACVFPARKIVLERIMKTQFPQPQCAGLDTWIDRIRATGVSLVFVGAYPGNPASILGHSFVRFHRGFLDASKGKDLLSYSVGFMAQADPRDNKLLYMVKGLTGGYDGFYEIEPHYMKVGLYNNSESRDLWELNLNFTQAEVDLLVRHLWELTFNARIPYFFIDENCSFRLITFLEVAKPEDSLHQKLSMIVLPAETVRLANEAGWTTGNLRFRASVKRRMNYKLGLLTPMAHTEFQQARQSAVATTLVQDPTAIDALLDFWLYENYRATARLNETQKSAMEATYQRAAELSGISQFAELSDDAIRKSENLKPPFLGHDPHWLEAQVGPAITHLDNSPGDTQIEDISITTTLAKIRYRTGVHPLWSADPGYAEISAIEYLGADLELRNGQSSRWNFLFIQAKSLNDFLQSERPLSWSFSAGVTSSCRLCQTTRPAVQVAGGPGLAVKKSTFLVYGIAQFQAATWQARTLQARLAPGLTLGSLIKFDRTSILADLSHHWWKVSQVSTATLQLAYVIKINQAALAEIRHSAVTNQFTDTDATLGWAWFF